MGGKNSGKIRGRIPGARERDWLREKISLLERQGPNKTASAAKERQRAVQNETFAGGMWLWDNGTPGVLRKDDAWANGRNAGPNSGKKIKNACVPERECGTVSKRTENKTETDGQGNDRMKEETEDGTTGKAAGMGNGGALFDGGHLGRRLFGGENLHGCVPAGLSFGHSLQPGLPGSGGGICKAPAENR